jgi:hypothetical protein
MNPPADVTVILTVWKRSHLEAQIEALLAQSTVPAHIWVLHYADHVAVTECLSKYPAVQYIHSSMNLKYYGRFTLALHPTTRYTWVLDDDIIPSPQWIETCIGACEKYNAIVCSNGRIVPPDDYYPEVPKTGNYLDQYFIGDSKTMHAVNACPEDTLVDYGCSSFFFKTEWTKYFWGVWPCTRQTGEDIHLSASCKIMAGISTVIPRQTSAADSGNVNPAFSCDEHASWRKQEFYAQRAAVFRYFIEEKNWVPRLW